MRFAKQYFLFQQFKCIGSAAVYTFIVFWASSFPVAVVAVLCTRKFFLATTKALQVELVAHMTPGEGEMLPPPSWTTRNVNFITTHLFWDILKEKVLLQVSETKKYRNYLDTLRVKILANFFWSRFQNFA